MDIIGATAKGTANEISVGRAENGQVVLFDEDCEVVAALSVEQAHRLSILILQAARLTAGS